MRHPRARAPPALPYVAERAIAAGQPGVASSGRAVAAAARRADEHGVSQLEDVLPAVVDRPTVQAHVAPPPVSAAR